MKVSAMADTRESRREVDPSRRLELSPVHPRHRLYYAAAAGLVVLASLLAHVARSVWEAARPEWLFAAAAALAVGALVVGLRRR